MLQDKYEGYNDFKTKFICDVPINNREVYRISNKEYRGMKHVDLRIFSRAIEDKTRLVPRIDGLWIERELLEDVIEGLILTRDTPARKGLTETEDNRIVVWQFYITEWEIYRFYKIRKGDAQFVEVRRMMMAVAHNWSPYARKGIVIEMPLVSAVITGLKKAARMKTIK